MTARYSRRGVIKRGAAALAEDIANASQSPDQRLTAFCVHLAAQAVDMHINNIGVRLNSHPILRREASIE